VILTNFFSSFILKNGDFNGHGTRMAWVKV